MSQKAQSLEAKQVLVLGLGVSGQSAVQFLLNRKALVVGVDRNPNLSDSNDKIANLCQQGCAQKNTFLIS